MLFNLMMFVFFSFSWVAFAATAVVALNMFYRENV